MELPKDPFSGYPIRVTFVTASAASFPENDFDLIRFFLTAFMTLGDSQRFETCLIKNGMRLDVENISTGSLDELTGWLENAYKISA